jgi:hypothetical protein
VECGFSLSIRSDVRRRTKLRTLHASITSRAKARSKGGM